MKSHKNLHVRIVEYENLLAAYKDVRRGKKMQGSALAFHANHESRLLDLRDELLSGSWTPDPFREFVSLGEVKRRVIHAPTLRDRVVHHAIVRVVQPLFERKWIYDSYACRKGKGTHAAAERTRKFLRGAEATLPRPYVLQIDIAKYYASISHAVLMEQIERTVADPRVLDLVERILSGFAPGGVGIPIGALTSQMFANVFLDDLDRFAKQCLDVKRYVRYMDDIVVVDGKDRLRAILPEIRWFAEARLRLRLNPKTRIYPASRGVDFCGYRLWTSHVRPRKRTVQAAKKRFGRLSRAYAKGRATLEDIRPRVMSFLGYIERCDGRETARSVLSRLVLRKERWK